MSEQDEKIPPENATSELRAAHAFLKIKQLEGQELIRAICEATVFDEWKGFATPLQQNPFLTVLRDSWHHWPRVHVTHRDLAATWLYQLDTLGARGKSSQAERPQQTREFLSLAQYIQMNIMPPDITINSADKLQDGPDLGGEVDNWLSNWFAFNQPYFDHGLDRACNLVWHGVPLYESHGDAMQMLQGSHPDLIYLSKKAEYDDARGSGDRPGMFPEWATRYHVKSEHLRLHDEYFGRRTHCTGQQLKVLRAAMLSAIGIESLPASTEATAVGQGEDGLRDAMLRLEQENEQLRNRVVEPDSPYWPDKLDQALMVWNAANKAKRTDKNPDRKRINGTSTGKWMHDWLRKNCDLGNDQADEIVKIANFAGPGRPARAD